MKDQDFPHRTAVIFWIFALSTVCLRLYFRILDHRLNQLLWFRCKMFRRIVCLMLVPAVLANLAASCCAHAHQGIETADHSARVHIHLVGEPHSHDSHSHHHGDSRDHKHSDVLPAGQSAIDFCFDSSIPAQHDTDAVYFGSQDDLQITSSRITIDGPAAVSIIFDVAVPPVVLPERQAQLTRAGPFASHRCAIYLQTRRLLL